MFEELRLLFNTNGKSQIIHIILAGQPSLHTILKRPEMSHFAQRVAICHTIEPLSEEESVGYVRQRIQAAGATQPIFTERACRLMHRLTKGVPRLINHAGDAALSYGAACQLPWITADVLFQALRKGQGMGLRPLTEGDTPVGTHQDTAEEQREMARSGGAENSPPKPFFPEPSPTAVSATERYERGLTLKNAGLYKQAIDQFQLAVDDPAMALKAYAQMGLCYKLSGRHAEAVTIFRKALSSSAASPKETIQILYVLGRSLEALGRTGEALEAYRWIRRESADYRDVVQRIERLSTRRTTPAFTPASSSETSWLGSLLRSKYP